MKAVGRKARGQKRESDGGATRGSGCCRSAWQVRRGDRRCDRGENQFFFSSRRRHTSLTCDWSSDVCSSDLGRTIAQVPIGEGVDGCAFDPGTGLAFSSNGEGSITVVHEDSPTSFHLVSTVRTRREIGRASCRERG